MFVCLSVCLPVCLSVCLFACLLACLPQIKDDTIVITVLTFLSLEIHGTPNKNPWNITGKSLLRIFGTIFSIFFIPSELTVVWWDSWSFLDPPRIRCFFLRCPAQMGWSSYMGGVDPSIFEWFFSASGDLLSFSAVMESGHWPSTLEVLKTLQESSLQAVVSAGKGLRIDFLLEGFFLQIFLNRLANDLNFCAKRDFEVTCLFFKNWWNGTLWFGWGIPLEALLFPGYTPRIPKTTSPNHLFGNTCFHFQTFFFVWWVLVLPVFSLWSLFLSGHYLTEVDVIAYDGVLSAVEKAGQGWITCEKPGGPAVKTPPNRLQVTPVVFEFKHFGDGLVKIAGYRCKQLSCGASLTQWK